MDAQLTFTCSKSTIDSPDKDVEYVQNKQKHQNDVIDIIDVVLVFLLLTLNIFYNFF